MGVHALRWVREQALFLIVALAVAASLLYLLVAPDHWRRGTAALAISVLMAGVLRLAVSDVRAGLLVVRGRLTDAATCALFGGLILVVDIRLHN